MSKSKHGSIIHHHYEIEKAFMCTSQDANKPKSYEETLLFPTCENLEAKNDKGADVYEEELHLGAS